MARDPLMVNAALHKTFPIWERLNFEFFAEATNVINHPSFQQPDSSIGPGHIGQITAVTLRGRSMMLVGKLVILGFFCFIESAAVA
jgi:hypothetical protein